jgi:hypothetical protein
MYHAGQYFIFVFLVQITNLRNNFTNYKENQLIEERQNEAQV